MIPRRVPLRKRSAKKEREDNGKKVYSTIRDNPKKAAKRLARTHGPKVFREFTKEQACSACGRLYHSVNAHVLGNGGLGRKRDWTTVAPLCESVGDVWCHTLFDEYRWKFDAMFPDFDAARAVAEHQAAYQSFLGADDGDV